MRHVCWLLAALGLVGCGDSAPPTPPTGPSVRPRVARDSGWQRPGSDTVHLRPLQLSRSERFDREQWETFAAFALHLPEPLLCELELDDRGTFLARHRLRLPAGPCRLALRFRPEHGDRSLDTPEERALVLAYRIEVDGVLQESGRYAWFGELPRTWKPILPAPDSSKDFLQWPRHIDHALCHFFWFVADDSEQVSLVEGGKRVLVERSSVPLIAFPRPVWVFRARF